MGEGWASGWGSARDLSERSRAHRAPLCARACVNTLTHTHTHSHTRSLGKSLELTAALKVRQFAPSLALVHFRSSIYDRVPGIVLITGGPAVKTAFTGFPDHLSATERVLTSYVDSHLAPSAL